MAEWSQPTPDWRPCDFNPYPCPFYQEEPPLTGQCYQLQPQTFLLPPLPSPLLREKPFLEPAIALPLKHHNIAPKGENPREIRNKAEKQRRDKLNHSISELAAMVPPVVASNRKIDKTGVLRLTAHYLRAHQYVFGDSIGKTVKEISSSSAQSLLRLLKGFLITTTYKGIVVVVSENVQQYLGYTELELLGKNIFSIVHQDDHQLLREQLIPWIQCLGPNGELQVPDDKEGKQRIAEALSNEKRRFIIRLKRLTQRSEENQYITCHVEGSLRKSDRACRGFNRCCQMVRRARARADNPCSSGNDVVFIGVVRPMSETFMKESVMESFRMEYRTRHSIDGEIIQCEQRISLITGYMTNEVRGVNAMNFMHRNDVRWVIIALREMYDQRRLYGESCYRLMTKSGEFVYMRTRGRLEVDSSSREVTSFVCTNTVVDEVEGRHHLRQMKKKFKLMIHNEETLSEDDDSECQIPKDDESVEVEDPRQLEKVILHLVTNLPSPQTEEDHSDSAESAESPGPPRLAIIPPKKERIVSAIGKIYNVIKKFKKRPDTQNGGEIAETTATTATAISNPIVLTTKALPNLAKTISPNERKLSTPITNPLCTPKRKPKFEPHENALLRRKIDGLSCSSNQSSVHRSMVDISEPLNSDLTSAVPNTRMFSGKIPLFFVAQPNELSMGVDVASSCVVGNKRGIDSFDKVTATKRKVLERQAVSDVTMQSLNFIEAHNDAAESDEAKGSDEISFLEQSIDGSFGSDFLMSDEEVQQILSGIVEEPDE